MPRKNRTEFGAIPIVAAVLGYGALLFLAASAGLWAWLLVGAVTIVLAVVLVLMYSRRHRHPAAEAAPRSALVGSADEAAGRQTRPETDTGAVRILLVANANCTSDEFREEVSRHAAGRRTEMFVVAPALASRLDRWTGDEHAYDEAQARLDATLATLTDMGVEARGHIGPHDPIQATDDGLRECPADLILLATGPEGEANWLEEGIVETARGRYSVPITHLVVEHAS
jgi:hypothetical protein